MWGRILSTRATKSITYYFKLEKIFDRDQCNLQLLLFNKKSVSTQLKIIREFNKYKMCPQVHIIF